LTRAQRVKIGIVVFLIVLLALLGAYYAYYKATHKLSFDLTASTSVDAIQPPEFLYSFSGTSQKLQRPIGVTVDGNDVYVCDSAGRNILVFDEAGNYKRSFGTSVTVVPLNVARNPKNNELYVTDRRLRKMLRFDLKGKYLGDFNPNLPKSELPTFKTGGVQWQPIAMAFAPDGTMYVTELLNGHRFLIFGPDGKFKKSFGYAGLVTDAKLGAGAFQFPNGIVYQKGLIYITDSNNRRVQIFDKDGLFKKIVVTQGLPRGIDFLNRFPADKPATPDRFVIADTLAHDGTIWTEKGDKLVSFGQQGFLDGQFNYPNGVSVGSKNKIFIADTANGRVQVWGWPVQVSPVPIPALGNNWWLCLLPLLLLPLLLLFRRRRFFATEDFVHAMVDAEEVDLMKNRRRKWLVTPEVYEVFKDVVSNEIELGKLLNATEHSDSDARALMEKLEVDMPTAIVLAIAQRNHVFCTEDTDYRRFAKSLEIDVVNRVEFIDRFERRRSSEGQAQPPVDQG
jgi:DNA-binding beta-propeller fold protein YncE/predicted nucleic acid-binding protein